jgi:hypothetical protein
MLAFEGRSGKCNERKEEYEYDEPVDYECNTNEN